jgi:hypothetical protein
MQICGHTSVLDTLTVLFQFSAGLPACACPMGRKPGCQEVRYHSRVRL